MHKLSQDPSKRVQFVNFEQEKLTCNFTPKITKTSSSYEIPDKNSENSSAKDDSKMNIVLNENTFQGLSNVSKPNPQSAAVMEKISKITTKPRVQCHIDNYKSLKMQAKVNHRFHFFPSPFQIVRRLRRLLRMEGIAVLEPMTQRRAVNSENFTTVTSNNAHDAKKEFR